MSAFLPAQCDICHRQVAIDSRKVVLLENDGTAGICPAGGHIGIGKPNPKVAAFLRANGVLTLAEEAHRFLEGVVQQ